MLELSLDTKVELATSALRHGAGLFETIRIQRGEPRWMELHLERMASGCAFLGFDSPPDIQEVRDFLHVHGVGASMGFGVLRFIAADGRLLAFAEPLQSQPTKLANLGLSLETVRFSGNPLNRFKTLSYLENLRLAQEAARRGHFDAIAPNEKGFLSDGGRTTLFAVIDGRIFTPPVADGALPGIARRVLLDAGFAVEASLRWEDLARTEAVFLANALRGVIPAGNIEGHGSRPVDHPAFAKARECLFLS